MPSIFVNSLIQQNPDLQLVTSFLQANGRAISKIEAVYSSYIIILPVASFEVLPAITNKMYVANLSFTLNSASATGTPLLEFYDPLTGVIDGELTRQAPGNIGLTNKLNSLLTSRIRFNQNGATVARYHLYIIGWQITYV